MEYVGDISLIDKKLLVDYFVNPLWFEAKAVGFSVVL